MKILHVIADLKPKSGGPAKAVVDICRALASEGHEVTIFTTNLADEGIMNVSVNQPIPKDGFTIVYFPTFGPRNNPISAQMARALDSHVKDFDIVETHGLYLFTTAAAAFYCRKHRVPYIMRPFGTLDPFVRHRGAAKKAIYTWLIERKNWDCAAAIHYTAQDEMDLAHYDMRIKAPGMVVPLGLELSQYASLPPFGKLRERYPQLKDKFVILFLGRIHQKKGMDLLAKAFGELVQKRDDVRLVIAGPDDAGYKKQVEQILGAYGALDKTVFTGMLYGEDKLAAFVDSDVFVLSSYSENFGIALVEAMACGLPVITSNKVNIWREVADANAGEVINCDVSELEEAIVKTLSNSELRRMYGTNGKKLVIEKFNWGAIADQLVADYRRFSKEQAIK